MSVITMASRSTKDYEYKFTSEPDDALKCLICLSVAKDPWQHGKCGRLFCRECIDKYGEDNPCPNCRVEKPQYFEDARSKYSLTSSYTVSFLLLTLCVCISVGMRDIRALHVKCDNVERGCEKEGTLGTLEEHMAVCQFTPLPCPKQCEIVLLLQKDLDHHINNECPNRDYECEYCGEKDTYANITQIHDSVCEKKEIPCTNTECTETIERGKMKNHLGYCDYTIIPCKYKYIGCTVKLKRKMILSHEQNYYIHYNPVIFKLQADLKSANEKIASLKKENDILRPKIFKISDYQKKKDNNEKITLPSFYTSHEGYHVTVKVYANGSSYGKGTHLSVDTRLLEGEHDDKLDWPFIGTSTITLLNQLADENHHSITSIFDTHDNLIIGKAKGRRRFIPHSELGYNPLNNTQYLKDDTLYFKVSVKSSNHKPWLEGTSL